MCAGCDCKGMLLRKHNCCRGGYLRLQPLQSFWACALLSIILLL